ncbi:hypothetical protein COCNU_01G013050 [Cocos nucifera]|uniref:Uncharacterized protein n=1 Tax=Cocos nucifera TaxID=13894 RepID=A0A8K0MUU2_COCNU|nr:hypothetical protein COCNU_01G013050 [Cocos nucifera]
MPDLVCHASFIVSFDDRYLSTYGKAKLRCWRRIIESGKKQKVNILAVAVVPSIDVPSVAPSLIDVPSIETSYTVKEAIVALAVSALTQEVLVLKLAKDISARVVPVVEELDADMVIVEPSMAPIKPAISRAPSMPKPMAHQQGKAPTSSATSRTLVGSESINIHVPLEELALTNLVLAKQLVDAILLPIDKKSQKKLEEERKKRKSSEAEVASVRVTFYQAKEQALEEFRGSEDFKEKLVAACCLAYMIGYEDDQDAVGQFYPNLDMTRVSLPDFDEEDQSVEDIPTNHVAPNKAAPIGEVASAIEPTLALREKIVEPFSTKEEMALTMVIVNTVVVDN